MDALPRGTVTFLFTDVEGSTGLLQRTREAYGELLRAHNELMRAVCRARGGHELGTAGDAFFFAFQRARDAIEAAVAAQRALAAHPWPPGNALRVRMGIHTGEPDIREEGYLGLALHRVARISAAGHGGQILVSRATADLVEDELPPDVTLRDLGAHGLKDFERPQNLFQVVADGLRIEFPPLRALEAQRARSISAPLEEQLLRSASTAGRAERRPLYRRPLVLAVLTGVLAAAVSIPVFAVAVRSPSPAQPPPNAGNVVVALDPESGRQASVAVGVRPADVVAGAGSVWVANVEDETVAQVDPATSRVLASIPIHAPPVALAAGADGVWVLTPASGRSPTAVRRIVPAYGTVEPALRISGPLYAEAAVGGLATGGGAVWVVPGGVGVISRLDPRSGRSAEIDGGTCCPERVAYGFESIWVTDPYAGRVQRITTGPQVVEQTVPLGSRTGGIAAGDGGVWVALADRNEVVRIDPVTSSSDVRIPVGRSPAAVAVGGGAVWVANSGDGTVSRIDPRTNASTSIHVGGSPQGIAFAGGKVWVSVQSRAEDAGPARGAVARLTARTDVGTLDPALAYTPLAQATLTQGGVAWQIQYALCAKLVNYPDLAAPAGARLVPEVAAVMPAVSRDGRTYTFRLRRSYRFSPPSNELVTAASFKRAIERSLSPRMNGPASVAQVRAGTGARRTLDDVVGVGAYAAGRAPHISGVSADGATLRIRLVRPAPDLLHRLAMPFFCAVPRNAPIDPRGVREMPSAGPYYVASHVPGQRLVLRRNPGYSGVRPQRLEEIRIAFEASDTADVEQGRVDYALNGVAPQDRERLERTYGRASPAVRANPARQRYFVNPTLELWYVALNTRRPTFASATARRAVNLGLRRTVLTPIVENYFPVVPTDQYLPPGVAGFRDVELYDEAGDADAARRLLGGRRLTAVMYTCWLLCAPLASAVKANLAEIGIELEVEYFSFPELQERLGRRDEPFDLAVNGWSADYPDGAAFFDPLFDGARLADRENTNISYFDDDEVNSALRRARSLTGRARELAYGELDRVLARGPAPIAALAVRVRHDFFSARMGCRVYHPVYGIDLARLCVREPRRRATG